MYTRTANFLLTAYLLFLNRPEGFARRRRIGDHAFIRYLLARNEAMKVSIRERADVARRARRILSEWKAEVNASSLEGIAYTLRVRGREEPLADPRRLRASIADLAKAETSGAMLRTLLDGLMIQELLALLGRDPVTDFGRLRPLIQDWAQSGTGPPTRTLAEFFPSEDTKRLRRLVRRAKAIVLRRWYAKLEGLERRAMAVIAKMGPLERLRHLPDRLRVCRHCSAVFFRPPSKRAQQYCPTCRRQWSKEQLWYRSGGKEKLQLWRAEARKEAER